MMSSPVQCLIQISNSTVKTTLITCRNDPTNYYTLETNIYIQIIIDINTCARYMTKYAAKGKLSSNLIIINFESCINHHGNNNTTYKALRGAMLCCVDKHDYSTQETAYLLLHLLLVSCTYNFIIIIQ